MRKITVPDEGVESLFGTYDENLKHLEGQFGVRIRTNGHELIVEGEAGRRRARRTGARAARRAHPRRLQARQGRREDGVAARRPGRERRARGLLPARRPADLRQEAGDAQERQPAPLSRRDRAARHRVRHRPGGHGQDVSRHGAGGRVSAGQAGQPHHPRAARRSKRGRSSAFFPATSRRRSTRTCGRSTTRSTT